MKGEIKMAVKIGSARIDENGKAHGGKAGDQTGKEVSTQAWYKHSKGWRVLRAKDASVREKIAVAMEHACANSNIGYDQWQRDTLLKNVKNKGFDPAKADTPCETDCSALVRVCCGYAFGCDIVLKAAPDTRFSTANMCRILLSTGLFTEFTGSKYTDSSDYLKRGDILCTKTQGHTVVVLSNGNKAENDPSTPTVDTERILRKGMHGEDVRTLQRQLMQLGYGLPKYGADGDFGTETLTAVMAFQKDAGLDTDGEVGPKTRAAMLERSPIKMVEISGGQCFVRTAPTTNGGIIGVAKEGSKWVYTGHSSKGWHKIEFKDKTGWVSGKYAKPIQ